MLEILCATGNANKFGMGEQICKNYGITLVQTTVDSDEIQGEDPEKIITRKAADAYHILQKPVVVTDDSWAIPGLNGFPGPYMKSMNHWFSPEDFLRLTKDLADRRIFIQQYIAYQNGVETVIFHRNLPGVLLPEVRPGSHSDPIPHIVALDGDEGRSIAEIYEAGEQHNRNWMYDTRDAWHSFAAWYKDVQATATAANA
jgi:inosine/xanthosine triphosphate pyrophosphatase family protein